MQPVRVDFQIFEENKLVDANCNAIQFVNNGSTLLKINNIVPLPPGSAFSVDGNFGEVIMQQFQLTFATTEPNNSVIVIRKIYI